MSLYSALYAGVAGLGAEATAMAVVADNISNINTIGYKGNDIQFRTLVSDGRAKSTYTAGGVMAAPQALISKQGLLQASSNTTDLGIEGGDIPLGASVSLFMVPILTIGAIFILRDIVKRGNEA